MRKHLQAYKENGTRAEVVQQLEESLFELYRNPELRDKPKELEKRGGAFYSDVACSLMDSIYNNKEDIQTVNTFNNGAIPHLPNDAVIEANCIITNHGPRPISVGALPATIKGLVYQMKAFEELVIRASISGDYNDAYTALLMNPLIGNEKRSKVLLDELLEAHKAYLPQFNSRGIRMNNKFMQKFIEIAGRIGAQRHLVAIRDGFVAIMPLIIVGSLAILINNFPPLGELNFVEWMNGIFGEGNWQAVGGSIWNGTFAVLGLLIAFSIAYNLAKSYEVDGLSAGLISAAAYIMLVPETPDWGLSFAWLGAQGLFVAIIIALVLTEIFRFLVKSKFTIKMPEGVPDGVAKIIHSTYSSYNYINHRRILPSYDECFCRNKYI